MMRRICRIGLRVYCNRMAIDAPESLKLKAERLLGMPSVLQADNARFLNAGALEAC